MSRLKNVGRRFQMTFQKDDGTPFYGHVLDIPDTARVTNFLDARRYLRVMPESPIVPTDVVVVAGDKYIVGNHGTGFYFEPIYKYFFLFQADMNVAWKKQRQTDDPITGQKKTDFIDGGLVWLSLQPKATVIDQINIAQQTFLALCNKAVSRGDFVDGMIVTKVDSVLGLYLLELKEK